MKPGANLARMDAARPAPVATAATRVSEPIQLRSRSRWRGWLAGPPQGWTSVALVVAMLWVMGLAADEAPWGGIAATIPVRIPLVPLLAVLSGLLGVAIGRSRLGPGKSHLLAAALGAAAVLIVVADAVSQAPTIDQRLREVNESMATFFQDVFVLGRDRTTERAWLLLLVDAIVWTTGYFAAFSVFRRYRALPAVVAAGAVLLVAMSATLNVRYSWLVAFSAIALLLFLRLNLTRQHAGWERRLIADGRGVTGPFLRGGATLVTLAVAGAVGLAAVASAAPLSGSWHALDGLALDLAGVLDRWTGGLRSSYAASSTYPDQKPISTVWNADPNRLLFTAIADDAGDFYWTAATYDRFDGRAWRQSDRQFVAVGAGEDTLASTADALPDHDAGRLPLTTTVTNQDSGGLPMGTVVAPSAPYLLDRPATVRTAGANGPMAAIDFAEPVPAGQTYQVDSLVPDPDDRTVFTEAILAAAGEAYPASISERYLDVSESVVGAVTKREARRILNDQLASERDPFHLADEIEDFLRSDRFRYETDMSGACRNGQTVSDCLLEYKGGFCQYYATTMVLMLRELDVPARYVEGYLPGTLLEDGTRQVTGAAAHAWVEAYFPDVGWWKFDPTPGSGNLEGQQPTSLPAGEPGTIEPEPTAEPSLGPVEPEPTEAAEVVPPPEDEVQAPSADPLAGWGLAALSVALAVLGAIVVVLAVWARRRPALEPDLAFRGIVTVATRFGYGRQPNQTPYEYTASLSRVVPGVAGELHTVARAKVESTYAQRVPGSDALANLRRAYRRARIGLIRLFFRPPVGD